MCSLPEVHDTIVVFRIRDDRTFIFLIIILIIPESSIANNIPGISKESEDIIWILSCIDLI